MKETVLTKWVGVKELSKEKMLKIVKLTDGLTDGSKKSAHRYVKNTGHLWVKLREKF